MLYYTEFIIPSLYFHHIFKSSSFEQDMRIDGDLSLSGKSRGRRTKASEANNVIFVQCRAHPALQESRANPLSLQNILWCAWFFGCVWLSSAEKKISSCINLYNVSRAEYIQCRYLCLATEKHILSCLQWVICCVPACKIIWEFKQMNTFFQKKILRR